MAVSQFKYYSSYDTGSPQLYGTSGSLLKVLNACLVDGYANKTSAGWLKPLGDTSSYGMFTQPSGSRCSFFLDDTSRDATYTARRSFLTGWESITSMNNGVATGSGQFPTFAQLAIASGSVSITKASTTTSSLANPSSSVVGWSVYADHLTCYLFIDNTLIAGTYGSTMFGDIYSFSASNDPYKAMIIGTIAAPINNTNEMLPKMSFATSVVGGHFLQRSYTGAPGGITAGKHGDFGKGDEGTNIGRMASPNPTDNGIYLCPIYVTEGTTGTIRGVMRGFWNYPHPVLNVKDYQSLVGSASGSFAGKSFMVIKLIGTNNAVGVIETSNTVYTN